MHTADAMAQSARLGWMPFYPQFDRNPLDLADEAEAAVAAGTAKDTPSYIADALKNRTLNPAIEDVDAPENWPRTLVLWRSNLFGSSAKGNEYFLRNLLGTHNNVLGKDHAEGLKPRDVKWHEQAPEGKLDLLVSADFRMTSTTLLSDVVLPGRHLVREARPVLHRHAPVRARLHPRDRPAVGDQDRLRHLPPAGPQSSRGRPRPTSASAGTWSASRCSTTPRASSPSPAGSCGTGGTRPVPAVPGRTCPSCPWSSATTPPSPTSWPPSGRWPTSSASRSRTSPTSSPARWSGSAGPTA